MLRRVMREKLAPYKRMILAMVAFQAIQTAATLVLPTLSARIIDNGVLRHDQGYIRRTGAIMLGFSLGQIVFAVIAVYLGGKVAMGFGRDIRRRAVPSGDGALAPRRSDRLFGAPSLITRDHQRRCSRSRLLVVMTTTMAPGGSDHHGLPGVIAALRQDVGLSIVIAVSVPILATGLGVVVGKMIPSLYPHAGPDRPDQPGAARADHHGIRVVRAFVHEPQERERFASEPTPDLTRRVPSPLGGWMATMFPMVNVVITTCPASASCGWGRRASSPAICRSAPWSPTSSYLTQILMSVMMATWMVPP